MSAVSNVNLTMTINAAATYTPTGVISPYQIPSNISFQGIQFINGNGSPLTVDLAAWGTVSLASTTKLIDFSALPDPDGITQDWTGGRVRILIVQATTTNTGFDLEVYADATNGIAWIPPVANFVTCRTNGGQIMWFDPNSNGSGQGNVITSSSKRFNFNSGSNTVQFNWLALGSSVA